MKDTQPLSDEHDWTLRVFAIEHARGILEIPDEIYEMLTDEEKITFILAGGMPSLFQGQQTGKSKISRYSFDTESGPLPVVY